MRKVTIVIPEWLGDSVLRQNLPTLATLAEKGDLAKIAPPPRVETPEALLLGIDPDKVRLEQGPLTIAALGADPPERSTHFHLSLMSLTDGVVVRHKTVLPPEQVDLVMARLSRLNTPSLTVVIGEDADHGLVWEGLGDLGTTSAVEADGQPLKGHLPEGDNEVALRRFIDDSVNLLDELEFNEQRIDEGLPPINLAWPWGQGVRRPVPNLALLRGEPAMVFSDSLRLQGLTRLAGYRHGDQRLFGTGLNARLEELRQAALNGNSTIIVINAFARLAEQGLVEERGWLTKQVEERFLEGLYDSAQEIPTRLTLLAPNSESVGLGIMYQSKDQNTNSIPFDERALEDRLPTYTLHERIDRSLT